MFHTPDSPGVWVNEKQAIVVFESGGNLKYWHWHDGQWRKAWISETKLGGWVPYVEGATLLRVAAERAKLPCGHHTSLRVRSVESNYEYCDLCETMSRMRDALTMEADLLKERNDLRKQLTERDAEIERLRKRDELNTELVSGIEKQLGIYGADATTTIGAEIEKLKTERDKAIENFNDYRSGRECDVSGKEAREAPHHCGELDKGCSCFKCRLHRQASTIRSLTQQLTERDAEVARLKEELAYLTSTHATTKRKLIGDRDFLEAANAELRKRVGQLEQHRDLYANATIHRCKKCGCLWRRWGDGSWSLLDRHQVCKSCCDNEAMGEQIEEIEIGLEYKRLVEELHKGKQP